MANFRLQIFPIETTVIVRRVFVESQQGLQEPLRPWLGSGFRASCVTEPVRVWLLSCASLYAVRAGCVEVHAPVSLASAS